MLWTELRGDLTRRRARVADTVSSGVPELDRLLGGGFTLGSTNYMEVERGTQELSFVAAFLIEGFRQKNLCGITLYDLPVEVFIERLTELGVNMRKALDTGSLLIADLYEEGEYDPERRGPILKTNNLNDPNATLRLYLDMAELARKRIESEKFTGERLVAYTASTPVTNYKLDAVNKLVKAARMQVRMIRAVNLSIFNPGMFPEAIVATLEDSCDSIITLSVKEVQGKYQRFLRVKQSPIQTFQMNEVPYDIIDGKPSLKPY
jgi:KaiC/GvpD/RAD55 family RecA-like ATPase